jgi:hypothetical protein
LLSFSSRENPGSPDTADGELILRSGEHIEDPTTNLGKGQFCRVYGVILLNPKPTASLAMKIPRTDRGFLDAFEVEAEYVQTFSGNATHLRKFSHFTPISNLKVTPASSPNASPRMYSSF